MSHVASLLNQWIGPDALFKTQKALADAAGVGPSTITGVLKAKQIEPVTLRRFLACLSQENRQRLLTAQALDAIPEEYAAELMDEGGLKLREEAAATMMSPLAQKTLAFLTREAVRDPDGQAFLEVIGRWNGLDKGE